MSLRAIDVAYNYLESTKKEISFQELWAIVKAELKYGDAIASKKISQFYTTLTCDGRFVNLENGNWALKAYCKYDEVAVKEEDYAEEEEEEVEEEEEFVEEEESIDNEDSMDSEY